MKAKIFSLMVLSVLALVFFVGMASALTLNGIPNYPSSISTGTTSFDITFDLSNEVASTVTIDWNSTIDQTEASFSSQTPTSVGASATNVTATVRITVDSKYVGPLSGQIIAHPDSGNDVEINFEVDVVAPIEVSECSAIGNPGELNIKKIDLTNNGFSGREFGDDDKWFLFDEVEVEIVVKNAGDYDVDDISVEWGIYDTKNNQWVIELDEADQFNIKDGDDERSTVSFKLDDNLDVNLDELSDGENYQLYVIATGTIDDSESLDDGSDSCDFSSEPAEIVIDSNFVVLDDIRIDAVKLDAGMLYPDIVSCESTLSITADVWNIGDRDQDEVKVRVYNDEMGIDEIVEIGNIDSYDKEEMSLEFEIPKELEEKWYDLNFEVLDEDDDVFQNDFDDDYAEFTASLEVSGNCKVAKAFVSASLESGGKAGKELIVRSTITNTGDESITYSVNVAGYSEWADSVSVEPSTLILDAGQSADVLIKLNVNKNALGEKIFNMDVLSEGELVISQPISVNIEKSLLSDLFGENGLLTALIIAIAIVLVIIIIVLAVRVARK